VDGGLQRRWPARHRGIRLAVRGHRADVEHRDLAWPVSLPESDGKPEPESDGDREPLAGREFVTGASPLAGTSSIPFPQPRPRIVAESGVRQSHDDFYFHARPHRTRLR